MYILLLLYPECVWYYYYDRLVVPPYTGLELKHVLTYLTYSRRPIRKNDHMNWMYRFVSYFVSMVYYYYT